MPYSNDAPLQRTLKIGTVSVGLLGLDVALSRVLAQPDLAVAAAVDLVYDEIVRHNYIPDSAAARYREALAQEIGRLRGGPAATGGHLEVRILGTGCVACNNLQRLVFEIVAERGIKADVFQVHDPDEIFRFGVLQTPALLVNGRIMSAGRLPSRAEVEAWLVDSVAQ